MVAPFGRPHCGDMTNRGDMTPLSPLLDPDTAARIDLKTGGAPLQELTGLRELLGGSALAPRLWVKRDDLLGIAGGGNKSRKLEFLVADAITAGATDLVTTGGLQSNHARQTAAAAAVAGLGAHLVLRDRDDADVDFMHNGNVLLDEVLGAEVTVFRTDGDATATMEDVMSALRAQGRRPYEIPLGGSTPLGSLGYVRAAAEIIAELPSTARIVCATGSGGTQSGLLAGVARLGRRDVAVTGYCVYQGASETRAVVSDLSARLAAGMGLQETGNVEARDGALGDGYGRPTPETLDAIRMVARSEGLLLDPVYTGKAMAGLIADIRAARYPASEEIVFVHTGGAPALYAYRSALTESATPQA